MTNFVISGSIRNFRLWAQDNLSDDIIRENEYSFYTSDGDVYRYASNPNVLRGYKNFNLYYGYGWNTIDSAMLKEFERISISNFKRKETDFWDRWWE